MPVDDEEDKGAPPSVFDEKGVRAFLDSLESLPTDDDPEEDGGGDDDTDDLTDDERKVLADFKGDPKALAKAYANIRELQARQGTELGDLRQKVEQLAQPKDDKPEEVEDPVWKTNEHGVKYIPDEIWRSADYVNHVIQQYLQAGYSDDDARIQAPIYINQQYNAHRDKVREETALAVAGKTQQQAETDDTLIQEQVQQQTAQMEKVTDAMAGELLLSYPEAAVVEILQQVEDRAKAHVAAQYKAGKISAVEATHPNLVEPLYYDLYAQMLRDGSVRKILTLESPAQKSQKTAPAMRPVIPGSMTPPRVSDETRGVAQRVREATDMRSMNDEDRFIFDSMKTIGLDDAAAMDAVKKTRGTTNGR